MRTVQLRDIFSDDTRNNLLDIYHNFDEYDTVEMNKAPVTPETLELVEETIRQCLGTDYVYVSGNYYHHTQPFYPHTDFKKEWKDSVNIVIPLEDHTNGTGRLVIFDQKWEEDSKTWMMIHPVKHYDVNTALPGCPFDYPLTNKTDDKIDEFFYKAHLTQFPVWCWQNLSGKTYRFEENSIIIFDNKRLHCTNNFKGSKTGLTLRYKRR